MHQNSTVKVNTLEDIIRKNQDSRNTSFFHFSNALIDDTKRDK